MKTLSQNYLASLLLPLVLFALVGCSSSDTTPADTLPPQSLDNPADQPAGDSTTDDPVDSVDLPIVVSEVASLLPGRTTVFGEEVGTFPNPNEVSDGVLYWNYRLVDDQLTADEFEAPLSHRLTWQRYADLMPIASRTTLTAVVFEVNVGDYDAGTLASVNAVNIGIEPLQHELQLNFKELVAEEFFLASKDQREIWEYVNTSLMIHEHAHVVHMAHVVFSYPEEYDSQVYGVFPPVRRDSIIATYYENFWLGDVYAFWDENQSDPYLIELMIDKYDEQFVSSYAMTNIFEDFAESFTVFVETDSIPSAGSDYPGAEKVIWFWRQPEYVTLRDQIRAAI